ncbi:class I SAM-dependent methyltransferase [Anaerococcus sp. AGMB00486]|uniref:Class I SAM-dependent methyltransferase n=2 Tax=Anaerococcus TaxID=165779 RepID=A0ABX2NBL7_9FIRM|nr:MULTISPECIES: class I SAM-dependent methyltransferase [Anaerococcus]MDY3006638.1 class I SAM-dependent methyltransferase [Anaerococcus porci]MSS78105.1 class I SAM-dependent methyltransferase [Anaerococcus porci]NVF12091.1 class I SAM-dependent methyltransferase [Anaerococcus faecalis]
MDFKEISKIDNDFIRNEKLYKFFDEEKRLFSKSGQIEKITTLKEISNYISQDSKILDVGAGTGVYSIPLAEKVNKVIAYEPATNNYIQIKEKIKKNNLQNITVENKSSLNMEELKDEYFDIVLLFGPMYHLSSEEDRVHTLSEAKRVVKAGGHILVSFINHDMIPMTEMVYNSNFFETEGYNPTKQRLINRPFIFFTLSECIEMLEKENLIIIRKVATSGYSELLQNQINDMSNLSYGRYIDWHLAHCDKEELLGASNHYLFVCKK